MLDDVNTGDFIMEWFMDPRKKIVIERRIVLSANTNYVRMPSK